MINTLCDDMLVLIMNNLDNKDSLNFVKTCKYMKNLFYKRGFLKTYDHDDYYFSEISKHTNSLLSIHLKNLVNPHCFLYFTWPKFIKFTKCYVIVDNHIDPDKTKTEELYIALNYYHLTEIDRKKEELIINWEKFQNLKYLYLNIYDIKDFTDIEKYCPDIEILFLYLEKSNSTNGKESVIPKNIGKLSKLKHLLTNCSLEDNIHFISKDLKTCIYNNTNNISCTFDSTKFIVKDRYYYIYDIEIVYNNLINK